VHHDPLLFSPRSVAPGAWVGLAPDVALSVATTVPAARPARPPALAAGPANVPGFTGIRSLDPPSRHYQPAIPQPRGPTGHLGNDIEMVNYDPTWPLRYRAESRRILSVLSRRIASIEHVGSSSIPGLGGRPDIDILVGVRRMREAAACTKGLRRLGYEEPPGRERYSQWWRFLKKAGTPVSYELLIVAHEGELWRHIVGFRDYLLAHPSAAGAYHRAKLSASARAAGNPAVYWEAKRRFLASIPTDNDGGCPSHAGQFPNLP